ncbi:MAG: AmmeMemoRadiSam system protein B [Spirochaetes bacterium]|nr:AmmeMemoRadiSam system protein B [Spirochaetota bacterium]
MKIERFYRIAACLLLSATTFFPAAIRAGNDVSFRDPAVAGTFYPSDPVALEALVDGYLKLAARICVPPKERKEVVMLLAPHAGYEFSGLTAACAFFSLEGADYDTVVLLGCPHKIGVKGAAVFCGKGFRMPWGSVPVDGVLARAVVDASAVITDDPRPHLPEHSLEVELPFLSRVLDGYSIVPVLVSGDRHTLELVAQGIVDALRKSRGGTNGVLFVVSTDLSHYPRKRDAEKGDREMLEAFCTLDAEALVSKDKEIMRRNAEGLLCTMCGLDAAYVGIRIANMIGGEKAYVAHMSTSADAKVPGVSAEKTVGYGAVVVTGRRKPLVSRFDPLKPDEGKYLLDLARRTLEEYLKCGKVVDPDIPAEYAPHLDERRGLFVTLYRQGALRGCIGCHMSSLPLHKAVQLMTLESALHDPRFSPLRSEELDGIRIELSVYLTHVEPISSAGEYVPGTHGIILTNKDRSATFLPQVPIEQGWDRKETLRQLSVKAGLPPDAWKEKDTAFSVYETQIFSER